MHPSKFSMEPKFYFHQTHHQQHQKNTVMPMTGELFPCSIPLAQPCMDPVNRLPLYDDVEHDNDGDDDVRKGGSSSGNRNNKMRGMLTFCAFHSSFFNLIFEYTVICLNMMV